jgi:hypothetical protein
MKSIFSLLLLLFSAQAALASFIYDSSKHKTEYPLGMNIDDHFAPCVCEREYPTGYHGDIVDKTRILNIRCTTQVATSVFYHYHIQESYHWFGWPTGGKTLVSKNVRHANQGELFYRDWKKHDLDFFYSEEQASEVENQVRQECESRILYFENPLTGESGQVPLNEVSRSKFMREDGYMEIPRNFKWN